MQAQTIGSMSASQSNSSSGPPMNSCGFAHTRTAENTLRDDDPIGTNTNEPQPAGNGSDTVPNGNRRENPPTSPLSELEQWVSASRLLEIVWEPISRPSLQWLRKETKRKMMPHVRRGRLIFYRPRSVLDWLNQRESRPNSMK